MVMGREQSYFISILQKNRHRSIDQEGTELSSCFSGIYASLAGEERPVRHAADTLKICDKRKFEISHFYLLVVALDSRCFGASAVFCLR